MRKNVLVIGTLVYEDGCIPLEGKGVYMRLTAPQEGVCSWYRATSNGFLGMPGETAKLADLEEQYQLDHEALSKEQDDGT